MISSLSGLALLAIGVVLGFLVGWVKGHKKASQDLEAEIRLLEREAGLVD